jgi:two-component system chemotaxis response regulator CheY
MGRVRFSILIADASDTARRAYRESLEPAGYEIVPAGTGREVIEVVHRGPVHLVVMDLRLPDYSGLEIYHAIQDERDGFLPCIFTASETSPRTLQDALGEGAVSIFPKPVDRRRLVRAVDRSIRRHYALNGRPSGVLDGR